MPVSRLLAATLSCAVLTSAQGQIDDLTTWDLYQDASGATTAQSDAMTGSAGANLAQLNFIDDVDIPAGFDVGYSSVNSNTVAGATSGYYFDASQSFTIRMHFSLDVTNPAGFVAIGMGIGEDRSGVNSAGIGFGVGNNGGTPVPGFFAAATNNDIPTGENLTLLVNPLLTPYVGSLSVEYDAGNREITVGATQFLGAPDPLAPAQTVTYDLDTDLDQWVGDDLLVSFFLRSDTVSSPFAFDPWTGEIANANFFDVTVVQGSAIEVPEPSSLALIGLAGLAMMRRRRR